MDPPLKCINCGQHPAEPGATLCAECGGFERGFPKTKITDTKGKGKGSRLLLACGLLFIAGGVVAAIVAAVQLFTAEEPSDETSSSRTSGAPNAVSKVDGEVKAGREDVADDPHVGESTGPVDMEGAVATHIAEVGSDPQSVRAIEEVIDLGPDAIGPMVELAGSSEFKERWASVVALGRLAHEGDERQRAEAVAALHGLMKDEDPTIRTYAAGALAGLGEVAGLAVLIDALELTEPAAFSSPPEMLCDWSAAVLRACTGQEFGFDSEAPQQQRSTAVEAWRQWFGENRDRLVFNGSVYEVR